MRMERHDQSTYNKLQMRARRYRPAYKMVGWHKRSAGTSTVEDNQVRASLSQAAINRNSTRGFTPGLRSTVLGEAGGRIPHPILQTDGQYSRQNSRESSKRPRDSVYENKKEGFMDDFENDDLLAAPPSKKPKRGGYQRNEDLDAGEELREEDKLDPANSRRGPPQGSRLPPVVNTQPLMSPVDAMPGDGWYPSTAVLARAYPALSLRTPQPGSDNYEYPDPVSSHNASF